MIDGHPDQVGPEDGDVAVGEIDDALFRRLALGHVTRKDDEARFQSCIDWFAGNGELKPECPVRKLQLQLFTGGKAFFLSLLQC